MADVIKSYKQLTSLNLEGTPCVIVGIVWGWGGCTGSCGANCVCCELYALMVCGVCVDGGAACTREQFGGEGWRRGGGGDEELQAVDKCGLGRYVLSVLRVLCVVQWQQRWRVCQHCHC